MHAISFHNRLSRIVSQSMFVICTGFAIAILALLALVTGYLLKIGFSSISPQFFTQLPTGNPDSPGGMRHAIEGTLILIAIASSIGVPTGLLAGVYLSEYDNGSKLAAPVRFVSDVLAGVPSIVVGILGYELLVHPMGHYSGWAGAVALAFIMIPLVTRTTEEMLRLVPNSYREASIALGATKARTILRVVLPSATGSVVTGVMLAIARVAGETAPLLFTALGSRFLPRNPNEQFPSLTVQIYDLVRHPNPKMQGQGWAGILVLIMLIFVLNLSIRFATRRQK